jgi:excinuclease UvrABC nuclease subunit
MVMAGTKVATLDAILVTRAKIKFPHRVNFNNITHNQIEEMAVWCINNCRGLWREEHYHALYFQFEDDYDAMMFMLKFGGRGNV